MNKYKVGTGLSIFFLAVWVGGYFVSQTESGDWKVWPIWTTTIVCAVCGIFILLLGMQRTGGSPTTSIVAATPTPRALFDQQISYWKLRLEHTITHLQTASKLIYLIDGAVLAFTYFTVTTLGLSRPVSLFISSVGFVLSGLNFLHSRFIVTQQHWYRQNDDRLLQLLKLSPLPRKTKGRFTGDLFTSSHRILSYIHVLITVWLLACSIFLLLYGIGYFSEIHVQLMAQ